MTSSSDPIELRVLDALVHTDRSDDVAALVGQPAATVAPALEWAVAQGLAARLDLQAGASYTLTPRGLETVSMRQQIAQAVNVDGRVDFSAATQLVMDGYQAAREAAVEQALRDQADWLANDGVRDRVTAALNDAYARGALTHEQLDTRTTAALSATTMGELRAAAHGVLDLPPLLSQPATGPTIPTGQFSWQPQVTVDPGVLKVAGAVRSLWRRRGGSDGDQPAADA
jgi:hypothetical protein